MSGKSLWVALAATVIVCPALRSFAGPLEERSNPVPNGSIVIDGNFADWAGVTPFSPDPAGDVAAGSNDWVQAWLAHDDTYLYFRFERAPGSLSFTDAGYRVMLDTDENIATGRNVLGSLNLSIGGEFSSNSALSMNRWPPGSPTCTSGLGTFSFAATSVKSPTVFEARVLRSALTTDYSNPVAPPATEFRFVCYGYTGVAATTDVYPDGGQLGGTNYFHYSTVGAIPPGSRPPGMVESLSNPVTPGAIAIDGDLSDWATITPYPDDPTGDGDRDFKSISIAHDDTYYYFRVEAAANSPAGLNDGTGWFWIMVDTNPAVAQYAGWVSTDSTDYIFQGPLIGSWGTSWDQVAFPPTPLTVEGAVRRSDMGDPAGMNLVFVGDNGPEFYPDGAYNADYFHYTVHPPNQTGGEPTEVYTLSNKVANGAITIDGDFSDWSGLTFFPDDAAGDGGTGQDWVRASIAHDDNNLYLMVERTPESATFTGGMGQGYWIVMDTDRDKTTGFSGFGARGFSIGGEYNWGAGATNAWASDGCFDHNVPMVTGLAMGDAEFAIARSTFHNPVDFNFALIGENSGDLYPDSAATAVFHYSTTAPLNPLPSDIAASLSNPVPDGAITVDGAVSDWQAVTPYPADAAGDAPSGSQDWVQVWVAHDSTYFYFRLKRAPGSIGWATPGYWIAFDTDRNPATGIKLGGTNTGAEFNTGGIVGFNRWNPDGSYAGGASFVATADGTNLSTKIEASIALSDLGNAKRFRVIYVGENSGDYYPEGANADKTFLYTFVPCHTPFADADGDGDVDQDDFGAFQKCFSGLGMTAPPGCECFDRDYGDQGDGDIDYTDLLAFLKCFSGPGVPASTTCGTP